MRGHWNIPNFSSQIQSTLWISQDVCDFFILWPYYLQWKLLKTGLHICNSITLHQVNDRYLCGWCWGIHANCFSLFSGRVCPLTPLTAHSRRQLNVVVWSFLKDLAEFSFFFWPKHLPFHWLNLKECFLFYLTRC